MCFTLRLNRALGGVYQNRACIQLRSFLGVSDKLNEWLRENAPSYIHAYFSKGREGFPTLRNHFWQKTRTRKVIKCPPNSMHFLGSLWPLAGSSVRRVEAKEHAGLKKNERGIGRVSQSWLGFFSRPPWFRLSWPTESLERARYLVVCACLLVTLLYRFF